MNNMRSSKLSLFLMELIIAILFFSLSAAVCVRLFASAHILSESTTNLENAVMWSQNLSEAFVSEKGSLSSIAHLFPDGFVSRAYEESDTDGSIILVFDDKWEPMENSLLNASYEVIMTSRSAEASEVYSDVNTYNVPLKGKAVTGRIAVYDIRGRESLFTDISDDGADAFHQLDIDVYVGEED